MHYYSQRDARIITPLWYDSLMRRKREAEHWDNLYREEPTRYDEPPVEGVVRFSRMLMKIGAKRVLDIGCGSGRNTVYLAENFDVFGLDISEEGLKLCSAKVPNAVLVLGTQEELPFLDDYFDAALSVGVLSFASCKGIRQAVEEMYRVVRKGGLIYVSCFSPMDIKYGEGVEVEKNTFRRHGITVHYFTEEEIYTHFKNIIEYRLKHFTRRGEKRALWEVYARA